MVYKNGDKYEGDWEEDLRSGLGIYYSFVGGLYRIRYQGEWRADRPHGRGMLYTDKGEPYEGEFMDGLRHGKGRQVYGGRPLDGFGGDIYEGDWVEDKRNGRGTLTCANGDIYEGLWANDLKHGEGTHYYISTNKRYDGVWHEVRTTWRSHGLFASAHANEQLDELCVKLIRADRYPSPSPSPVQGVPKCGTYGEVQQSLPGDPGMLPVLELRNPRGVLEDSRQQIMSGVNGAAEY